MTQAMDVHGAALLAYFNGDTDAELIVRRDDGREARLPVSHFFRSPDEFTRIENAALELCRGHVLDVGAGTGLHSLALQDKGLRVTAIDVSPEAVAIMAGRGVADARPKDIFEFDGGSFDTVLMLGHGIGMVGTPAGLDRFLDHVRSLLTEKGQVLLDSLDVRVTDDPKHKAYHEANERAGRYPGEIRLQFEFQGECGPYCRWLHVDTDTLAEHAHRAAMACELILKEGTGDYLARVTT